MDLGHPPTCVEPGGPGEVMSVALSEVPLQQGALGKVDAIAYLNEAASVTTAVVMAPGAAQTDLLTACTPATGAVLN